MLLLFYFFAAVSIWLGLLSIRSGVRFVYYVQTESGTAYPDFTPFVTVMFPMRGVEEGLRENITALFAQDYPAFEVIFVSDAAEDPAWAVMEDAKQSFAEESGPVMQTLVAGSAVDCGQKVHNLRLAVTRAHSASEVFVFVDSDAQVAEDWLISLVTPLQDRSIGATTGYRWFVPRRRSFAAHLLSVWNAAIASALGDNMKRNFCWGGSTAIRRSTFELCRVMDYWRGTVSDDFAITRAVHDAGLPIKFVPQCLTPSWADTSRRELIEFTTRQLKITRAYAAHLWKGVFFGSTIFVLTFFGGIVLVASRAALGRSFVTPLFLLALMFAMGAVKGHLRLRAVATMIANRRVETLGSTIAHVTLWPVASALYLYNCLIAAVSRRIRWRGITYELKSPNETVIIRRR